MLVALIPAAYSVAGFELITMSAISHGLLGSLSNLLP